MKRRSESLIIRERESNPHEGTTSQAVRGATPRRGRNPCRLLLGKPAGAAAVANSPKGPQNTKHTSTPQPGEPTSGCRPESTSSRVSARCPFTRVHNSAVHQRPRGEAAPRPPTSPRGRQTGRETFFSLEEDDARGAGHSGWTLGPRRSVRPAWPQGQALLCDSRRSRPGSQAQRPELTVVRAGGGRAGA